MIVTSMLQMEHLVAGKPRTLLSPLVAGQSLPILVVLKDLAANKSTKLSEDTVDVKCST